MREIGHIRFVQIQRQPLKVPQGDIQVYDPAPLLTVAELFVEQDGCYGLLYDGTRLIDSHHAQHPQSRYNGRNGISIGFTAHYALMRERFGDHVSEGQAGENVIIETTDPVSPQQLGERIAFRREGLDELIYFEQVVPAPPCVEFSRFISRRALSPQETKATLQFLDNGLRGFYCRLIPSAGSVTLKGGDVLLALDD